VRHRRFPSSQRLSGRRRAAHPRYSRRPGAVKGIAYTLRMWARRRERRPRVVPDRGSARVAAWRIDAHAAQGRRLARQVAVQIVADAPGLGASRSRRLRSLVRATWSHRCEHGARTDESEFPGAVFIFTMASGGSALHCVIADAVVSSDDRHRGDGVARPAVRARTRARSDHSRSCQRSRRRPGQGRGTTRSAASRHSASGCLLRGWLARLYPGGGPAVISVWLALIGSPGG
jgi:hypothetical protein